MNMFKQLLLQSSGPASCPCEPADLMVLVVSVWSLWKALIRDRNVEVQDQDHAICSEKLYSF